MIFPTHDGDPFLKSIQLMFGGEGCLCLKVRTLCEGSVLANLLPPFICDRDKGSLQKKFKKKTRKFFYRWLFKIHFRPFWVILLNKNFIFFCFFLKASFRDYELHQRSIENLSKLLDGWWKGKSHRLGHKLWTLIPLLKQERDYPN